MIHVDESTVVLGIETSCDETAAAVVMGGNDVLSSVVATQIEQHARFGGVVPEIASRAHVEAMTPVVRKAMSDAGVAFERIDAVAATACETGAIAARRTRPCRLSLRPIHREQTCRWLSPSYAAQTSDAQA